MSAADWPTTRARIVDAFDGELPGRQLETALVDLHTANPASVLDALPSVAESLANGRIKSGWAVLRKAAAERATRKNNPTIDRAKKIEAADTWLRNAGCHYDRWHEIEDTLFGDRGTLRDIADDKLRARYKAAWETVRIHDEAAAA